MKYIVLTISVLLLILGQHVKALYLQEDTMDTWKSTIVLSPPSSGTLSSGILKSHIGSSYTTGRNKTLYVNVPYGYSLMVSIRYIDLRPNSQDKLTLFSVDKAVFPKEYSNFYSFKNKRDFPLEEETYYIPSGNLGVTFATGPWSLSISDYDGFKLVYTVQGSSIRCNSRNFYCNNLRCIADVLKCDGHNHCGDRSSERNCFDFNPGRLTGIIFGSVFLVIAAAIGVYVVFRRRRGYISETIVTSHPPPPTNIPSYPPSYPQQGIYYPPPPPAYSQGVTNPGYQ